MSKTIVIPESVKDEIYAVWLEATVLQSKVLPEPIYVQFNETFGPSSYIEFFLDLHQFYRLPRDKKKGRIIASIYGAKFVFPDVYFVYFYPYITCDEYSLLQGEINRVQVFGTPHPLQEGQNPCFIYKVVPSPSSCVDN